MTIAVVYGADSGATASSTTITRSATTSAGDGVLVWVKWGGTTATLSTVSDGTNTFTPIAATLTRNTDNLHSVQLCYCPNVGAGTRTITVTFSATVANRAVAYFRVTGADTNAAQAGKGNFQVSPGPGTGADAVTSGTATPTSQPGAVIAVSCNHISASTINAGTGFTALSTIATYNSLQGDNSNSEWKRITSTSAVAGTFTATSASEEFETVMAIIGEAGAGGTTVALTGVSATTAVGSVVANDTPAATGNQASGAVGNVTANVSTALTGNAASGAVGSLGASVSAALTGTPASGAAGSVAANVSVGLTGVQAAGSVGTVTPGTGITVALTGVEGAGSAGNLGASVDTALSGAQAAGAVGSVTPGLSLALTGTQGSGSAGNVAASVSAALSGAQASGQVGSIGVSGDITLSLTGVSAQGQIGAVSVLPASSSDAGHSTRRIAVELHGRIWYFEDEDEARNWLNAQLPDLEKRVKKAAKRIAKQVASGNLLTPEPFKAPVLVTGPVEIAEFAEKKLDRLKAVFEQTIHDQLEEEEAVAFLMMLD